ncbi:hypothetical protein [Opitutus sp. GAS368]|uniref:hypothetical protein n=1 Tax=Opitutus sp. GAS368 TaxID=1882749 RepID=UPI00087B0DC1|nr:hypothetical protein [Opitutus sp. GAS368]SDR89527.1 hypothetical protein SAMN05444173_1250 [Opitutus sp. GAS368]
MNCRLLLLLAFAAGRLSGVMIDEIQVYTDDLNAPGKFGLELHVNTTLQGRDTPDYPGEITPQHGLRLTPEFSYGLPHGFEAGLYLPAERTGGGSYLLAGSKVRLKWLPVLPDEKLGGWFFGLNGELSYLQARFDQAQWGFELRTMAGYRAPGWLLAANPVLGWGLSGPDKSGRPETELQLKAAREIVRGVSFGPEYYADFGRLGRALPSAAQAHTLYAAFDVDLHPWVFNCGIGRGLTSSADRWTLKFIFEVPW